MDYFNKWLYWKNGMTFGYVYFMSIQLNNSKNYIGWVCNENIIKFYTSLGHPANWSIYINKKIPKFLNNNKREMVKDCFENDIKAIL